MCGNKRRQARMHGHPACGRRSHHATQAGGVAAIIGTLQSMRLGNASQQPPMTITRDANLDTQSHGVVYPSAAAEKQAEAQHEAAQVQFEELPSYDQSTRSRSTPEEFDTTHAVPMRGGDYVYHPHPDESVPTLHRSNTDGMIDRLQQFRSGLQQYKDGAHDGKWVAKRAARSFMRDLYDQEVEKRKGDKGYLQCGERKQVRRELKPVKHMLKTAVWEAKMERKGCF